MLGSVRLASLLLASLATGLIAGFFYAYDCSVMLGLERLDAAGFVRAMQAINATVRNEYFAASFFGALAGVDPSAAPDLTAVRRDFAEPWMFWNRVRTAASTVALTLLLGALYAEGRRSTSMRRVSTALG